MIAPVQLQTITKLVLTLYLTSVMSDPSKTTTSKDALASQHKNPLQNSMVDKSCVTECLPNECDAKDQALLSADDSQCTDDPAESMTSAVVVFRPTFLHAFREESKQFTFVGRTIVIKQKWEDLGVAAVVWDAAVVLAEYLEENSNKLSLKGKAVIELGAGTGLVSMVAALLGASVIATDRKIALEFLQENIRENFPNTESLKMEEENEAKDTTRDGSVNIEVMELDWGQNHKDFSPVFNYIVGADIVYIEETFEQLLETLLHLTKSNQKSRILLSCRIRYDRDVRFLKTMEDYFMIEEIHYDERRDIKIYQAELVSINKQVRKQEKL